MTHFKTALITLTTLASVATTASAGESGFTASFNFDENAPIELSYANFETAAKRVCHTQVSRRGKQSLGHIRQMRDACQAELVGKAVAATRNEVLITYHYNRTNPKPAVIKLAERN